MKITDLQLFFGGVKLDTSLYKLCKMNGKPEDHLKIKREYWMYIPLEQKMFTKDRELIVGWHKLVITYKRSGIVFWKFPEYGKRLDEQASWINSMDVIMWHPVVLSKNEFNVNSAFSDEIFDTVDGRIKIVD